MVIMFIKMQPLHVPAPFVSWSEKSYPHCLVLVGSRNGFESDFTIEVN